MPEASGVYRDKTTYLGRDYQTFSLQHQIYFAPVDDDEEKRLRKQHDLMLDIFSDRTQPLLPDFVTMPETVLDCGYGTGDWACEVAETFDDCNVFAVDISPIMELSDVPDNLTQEIEDLNEHFTFSANMFDFVHSRFVAGGIAHLRWPGYLTDIKRVLKSKGWAQLTEWDLVFRSNNDNTDKLSSLRAWSETYHSAITKGTGNGRKSRTVPEGLETMMRTSGFLNVQCDIREIPTCAWSSSKQSIGKRNRKNMRGIITSSALYPVTFREVMSASQLGILIDDAVAELGDESAQPYVRLYTVYGQKG